jgi:hypothetical protein
MSDVREERGGAKEGGRINGDWLSPQTLKSDTTKRNSSRVLVKRNIYFSFDEDCMWLWYIKHRVYEGKINRMSELFFFSSCGEKLYLAC